MTRYAKLDSPYERIVGEIEEVLRRHEVRLTICCGQLVFVFKDGKEFDLTDTDGGSGGLDLPRTFTSERLGLRE